MEDLVVKGAEFHESIQYINLPKVVFRITFVVLVALG